MPRHGHTFILFCALGMAALGRAQPPVEPMIAPEAERLPERMLTGLDELIAKASDEAPRIVQRRLEVLMAEQQARMSRAVTRPLVSATGDAVYRQEVRSDVAGSLLAFKYFYSLRAEQPLYHWGALLNEKRIGEIQLAMARSAFDDARAAFVQEIRASYAGLVLRELEFKQGSRAQERAEGQLAAEEERGRRGEQSPEVLVDLRLNVDQARIGLERARAGLTRARQDFALLLGRENLDGIVLPTEIETVPDVLAEFRRVVERPETEQPRVPLALQRVDRELEAARLSYEIERVRLRPKINLLAGIGQDEVSYTTNIAQKVEVQTRYVGVSVRWNLFDGFYTKASTQKARLVVRAREQALRDAETALERRLRTELEDLEFAQRDLALAEKRFALGGARLRTEEARRAAGQISAGEWDQLIFNREQERIGLLRGRVVQILRLSEYAALLRQGTTPASSSSSP